MNIVFISSGLYPDQHAAAIRHSTIAQGFVENGHNLNFFLLTAQSWQDNEINYKGVEFRSLNNYRGNNKFKRFYYFVNALKRVKKEIVNIHNSNKIDGIVVFSIDVIIIKTLVSFARRERIKIFHERTELPYIVGRGKSILGKLTYHYYLKYMIPEFDGIFVISDKLKEFLASYNNHIQKILTVVDTSFFNIEDQKIYDFPYIAYCGNMCSNKDGILILIESFAQLSQKFPNHKLVLIGKSSNSLDSEKVMHLVEKLNIKNKVKFTGFVDREEMPRLLCAADLLVVSKPDNEQNSGNFPIKIGEYLATGVPVVVTKVGEIPKFIEDGQTGFLALPDSIESFYQKMHEALTDYKKSMQIGMNGKKIAEQTFDYRIQAKKMAQYINDIEFSNGN